VIIVGVDCAAQWTHTGVSVATYENDCVTIGEAWKGRKDLPERLCNILIAADTALLALDAPLGWPAALGSHLLHHSAGCELSELPDQLFSRETDRFVQEQTGKKPLEVGADKIARAAAGALRLLAELRSRTGTSIPLAWTRRFSGETRAIEVYPAATMLGWNFKPPSYKKPARRKERAAIVRWLGERIDVAECAPSLERSDDVLDSALCVLAGADFLRGDTFHPPDPARARREGWIWLRSATTG
jgi:predicted nuclease with RNAse H fold